MRPLPKLTFAMLFSGLMIFGLNSCTQDYFKLDTLKEDPFTWQPDLAFPLVYSVMSAEDILTNVDTTNIYLVENDGFVTLIYRNVVFSQTINKLFVIPNGIPFIDVKQLSGGEVTTLNNSGSVQSNFAGNHNYDTQNTNGQLDFIEFHEGSMLNVNLVGDFQMEGSVVVTYPELTINGTPLSHTFSFDNSTGIGIDQSASLDVTGYRLALNAPTPNNMEMDYLLSLSNGTASTSNSIVVTSSFNNADIGLAEGDFGQSDLGIDPDVVDIDILDNQQQGEITFFDPRLKITMKNSFGMAIQGTINQMRAIGDGAQFVDVEYHNVTGQVFTIPGATNPGDTASVEWYFTGTQNVDPGANSNIDIVINANYQDMVYDLDAITNPPGSTPFPNWANRNSAIEVTADVELPFWGTAENFTIRDTIDSPISEAEDFRDNIVEALLRVNTLNGFPVDGQLKLYFTDSTYAITDSVLANGELLLASGLLDGGGRVTTPTNQNNDIILDESRIDNVFGSHYIILDAVMNSTNLGQTPIKIYDDYELEVHLGFQVKLSASPSDLGGL